LTIAKRISYTLFMERFQSELFTDPKPEHYETFACSDNLPFDSAFERSISDDWADLEAIPVEYGCPEAARLINAMEAQWTPRDLRQLGSLLKAHAAVCSFCKLPETRKPAASETLPLVAAHAA